MPEIKISYEHGYLYTDNFGNKVEFPDYCQKTIEKIKKLEKQAARRQKGSNNYEATVMKIHDRRRVLKAQIHDYVGKVSNDLISNYDHIVIIPENINEAPPENGINYAAAYRMLCKWIREKHGSLTKKS